MLFIVYTFADALVGVSQGVADRLRQLPSVSGKCVHVVMNGVDVAGIAAKVAKPLDDPWSSDRSMALILAIGRLTKQENLDMLIKAFDCVRKKRPARSDILGEGEECPLLQSLIGKLVDR